MIYAREQLLQTSLQQLQQRIGRWVVACLGTNDLKDRQERARRVLEEAAELAQAESVPLEVVQKIIARTWSRPVGEPAQEAAGLGITLLAWAESTGTDLGAVLLDEVHRIEQPEVMARIRENQIAKAKAGTGAYPDE